MPKIKNKIQIISFIILSYLALINSLIEIPLAYKNIKDVSEKKIIKAKKLFSEPSSYFRLGKTISYDEETLTLNDDYYFLATVKIGSKEEKFNLILETGSTNLWVVQGRARSPSLRVSRSYDPNSSTSAKNTGETFQLNYGTSGSVSGTFFTDDMKFMNNKVFNMKFGVSSRIDLKVMYGDADGVIGLGHYYEDEEMSFMHMLKQNDVTDSKIFSIKLDNDADIEEDDVTGKLYIGKHEDFSSDKSVTCPLVKADDESNIFWTFQLDGIGLKKSDKEIKASRTINVILETATNYITLPYDYLSDIQRNLADVDCQTFREGDRRSSTYYIRCSGEMDTLPDFQLNINGTILTIPAKYAFELDPDHDYYSRIIFTRSADTYIIGSPFLFAYHTLFDSDNEQLHFYPTFEEKDDGKEKENENEKENEKENDKENEKENE